MKTAFCLLIILLATTLSCNQAAERKEEIKPLPGHTGAGGKVITVNKQPDTVRIKSVDTNGSSLRKKNATADNNKILTGLWLTPHAADVRIIFSADGTFVFNDYNTNLQKEEKLTGRYLLKGHTLTLMYSDRPKQNFQFHKGEGADSNYYLTKAGYYFVKTESQ